MLFIPVPEWKEEIDELKNDMAELKYDMAELKNDMAVLDNIVRGNVSTGIKHYNVTNFNVYLNILITFNLIP